MRESRTDQDPSKPVRTLSSCFPPPLSRRIQRFVLAMQVVGAVPGAAASNAPAETALAPVHAGGWGCGARRGLADCAAPLAIQRLRRLPLVAPALPLAAPKRPFNDLAL